MFTLWKLHLRIKVYRWTYNHLIRSVIATYSYSVDGLSSYCIFFLLDGNKLQISQSESDPLWNIEVYSHLKDAAKEEIIMNEQKVKKTAESKESVYIVVFKEETTAQDGMYLRQTLMCNYTSRLYIVNFNK